jgi:hypothetical protein
MTWFLYQIDTIHSSLDGQILVRTTPARLK